MGAPKGQRTGEPRKAIGVRLRPDTTAWLDSEADRCGMTRATVAALCIERCQAATSHPVSGSPSKAQP